MNRWFLLVAALSCSVSLAAGCSGDNDGAPAIAPVFDIAQRDFSFEPASLTELGFLRISSGPVTRYSVRITNQGSVAHTFTITELSIDAELKPGEQRTVDIPTASGSLSFFCRFHRDRGMTGFLQIAGSATPTP